MARDLVSRMLSHSRTIVEPREYADDFRLGAAEIQRLRLQVQSLKLDLKTANGGGR
jgi:hypothetical protein